ncbi:LPS assembly protein LptD [Undibacterium arcticum]
MPRETSLSYTGDSWKASAHVARYQVLQDIAVPIARPYDRVPQLMFHTGQPDLNGFNWALDSEATRFFVVRPGTGRARSWRPRHR